ncbi:hypothetical protein HS088_TW16G00099 [Tripterygium wilfordii]|uniref:S-protein homolog n=1 Tax=Tripterygium wilfordii TaxID=458696 RepID=A0A7J7CI00_TRIWF|nr:hypothetical protein HS088_TW16G00099 [Tripterygium wilfordii]
MNQPYFLLFIQLLLTVTLSLAQKNCVQIYNELGPGVKLTLHCQSADDDLGWHTISAGQIYGFSFGERIIGKTLFWCRFQWNGLCRYFDVYKSGRDRCLYCSDKCYCYWYIRPNGPYWHYKLPFGWNETRFDWNPDPCK